MVDSIERSPIAMLRRTQLDMKLCETLALTIALCLILLLLVAPPASAWGEDGHRFINRVAAEKLPETAPQSLRTQPTVCHSLGRNRTAGVIHEAQPEHWPTELHPTTSSISTIRNSSRQCRPTATSTRTGCGPKAKILSR